MRKVLFVLIVAVFVLATPSAAFAHHVGNAINVMPAEQWEFVDSVAHGAATNAETPVEPAESMNMGGDDESDVIILAGDQVKNQRNNPSHYGEEPGNPWDDDEGTPSVGPRNPGDVGDQPKVQRNT